MGFDVSYIIDILKFPWPLFPRYKKTFPIGVRYDIPALIRDFEYEINLPAPNKYELQSLVFSSTGYKDTDSYSLYKNGEVVFHNIYTKELGQSIEIRPVVKVEPGTDTLKFIFHNNTGTSKVIWVDFMFTANKIVNVSAIIDPTKIPVSPLAYFYATSEEEGYVNPSSISTAYWARNLTVGSTNIRTPFWEGRNNLLNAYGNFASLIEEPIDNYYRYLFKFVRDTQMGFTHPLFSQLWSEFKNTSRMNASSGGLGLYNLSELELAQIYLSNKLRTPVIVFPEASLLLEGNRIDLIKNYIKPYHMFVFDWIDFNDAEPDENVGGFAFDPSGHSVDPEEYGPFVSIKSYINIETVTLSLDVEYSRTIHPMEYYFPEGSESWLDAHYHYMDAEQDPLSAYILPITDPSINVAEVFVHETAHAIDFYQRDKTGMMFSRMPEWLNISGWDLNYYDLYEYGNSPILQVPDYKSNLNDSFEPPVTAYGASHPMEDFAETYALYCINPKVLQEQFPKRHSFMEKYIRRMQP